MTCALYRNKIKKIYKTVFVIAMQFVGSSRYIEKQKNLSFEFVTFVGKNILHQSKFKNIGYMKLESIYKF